MTERALPPSLVFLLRCLFNHPPLTFFNMLSVQGGGHGEAQAQAQLHSRGRDAGQMQVSVSVAVVQQLRRSWDHWWPGVVANRPVG